MDALDLGIELYTFLETPAKVNAPMGLEWCLSTQMIVEDALNIELQPC
jgi:hypothetical protein